MKKSKIIVPAIAMIAFSTAASIAGSVAWFTASRQVTINAGTYTVVKTTTNLEVKLEDGIGTTAGTKVVNVGTNLLSDASFDYDNEVIHVPNQNGDAIAESIDLADATPTNMKRQELTSAIVYSALTFDIEFSFGFNGEAGNYGLYLDEAHSSFTGSGSQNYTANGFRIAFIPTGTAPATGSERSKLVFAGLRTADDFTAGKVKYVNGASNFDGTAYDATKNVLVYKGYGTSNPLPAENTATATATARADYLGTFGFVANGTVKLHYTAVCWFEGTDPDVVNQDDPSKYQNVQTSLTFTTIKLGA